MFGLYCHHKVVKLVKFINERQLSIILANVDYTRLFDAVNNLGLVEFMNGINAMMLREIQTRSSPSDFLGVYHGL